MVTVGDFHFATARQRIVLGIKVLEHVTQRAEVGVDGRRLLALIVDLDGDHVALMPSEHTGGNAIAADGHQRVVEREILAEGRLGENIITKVNKINVYVAAATAVVGVALREAVSLAIFGEDVGTINLEFEG